MMPLFVLARLALGSALVTGALLVGSAGSPASVPVGSDEQAYAWNCDGTWWAFRVAPLPDGSVGVAFTRVPVGAPREPGRYEWSPPVSLGGQVAGQGDLDVACLAGRVWVFAKFSAPMDGTAQLYERHAFPEDAANGTDQGWVAWYHWR